MAFTGWAEAARGPVSVVPPWILLQSLPPASFPSFHWDKSVIFDKLLMSAGIHFFICRMGCEITRWLNVLLEEQGVCYRVRHFLLLCESCHPHLVTVLGQMQAPGKPKVLTEGFKDGNPSPRLPPPQINIVLHRQAPCSRIWKVMFFQLFCLKSFFFSFSFWRQGFSV